MLIANIFPNPVIDEAYVDVNAKETIYLKASLYSNTGKLVKSFPDKTIHSGKQIIFFQFGTIPVGIYYLVFEDGREAVVRKVVRY